MIRAARALVRTWLLLDFFGESRRRDQASSSLTSTIFTQSFIALVVAAVLFDTGTSVVAYAAANLSLSTMLVGIGVLGDPDKSDRSAADRLIVKTAPIARATLPLARVLHGAFHLSLVTTGMAIPPAILLYWVSGGQVLIVGAYLLIASLLAGLLAGGLALLMRILLRFQGPMGAALIAGTLKALLLGGLFLGFALSMPHMQDGAAALPFGRAVVLGWPPYWGARFLGAPAADFGCLLALCGTGLLCYLGSVAVGEEQRETSGPIARRRSALAAIDRHLARGGPLLGATAFVAAMLYRSPGFRGRVLPLFGMPLAMVLLAYWEQGARERQVLLGMTLQFPAMYLPFLVLFLPIAEQPGAGWLFDTSPRNCVPLAREASLIALSTRILLPVHLAAGLLVLAAGFGPVVAASLATFSWGLAVLLAAVVLKQLECMPFTVSEAEAEGPEFGNLLGVAVVLALCGCGFALIADGPLGVVLGTATAALAWRRLRAAPHKARANAGT